MKFWSILFASLMFLALFGVPIAQICLQNDNPIVLQELEENDMEEGEDVKLKDVEENLFHTDKTCYSSAFIEQHIQAHLSASEYCLYAQELGVETPPPRFA